MKWSLALCYLQVIFSCKVRSHQVVSELPYATDMNGNSTLPVLLSFPRRGVYFKWDSHDKDSETPTDLQGNYPSVIFVFYEHPNFKYREETADAELLCYEMRTSTPNRQTDRQKRDLAKPKVFLYNSVLSEHKRPCLKSNRSSGALVPQFFNKHSLQGRT